jgi:hypothetical protein
MDLVRNASEPIIDWPAPNRDDVVLIGKIVMIYSYVDFDLRRMIEVLDHAKALPPAWLGKIAKMHLSDIEAILETAPDIAPNNALALRRIKEFRKLRNLLAHFEVKRFPTEDALVFVTKDAADYRRVLGAEPDPGVLMTAVAELGQIRDVCRMSRRSSTGCPPPRTTSKTPFSKPRPAPPDRPSREPNEERHGCGTSRSSRPAARSGGGATSGGR